MKAARSKSTFFSLSVLTACVAAVSPAAAQDGVPRTIQPRIVAESTALITRAYGFFAAPPTSPMQRYQRSPLGEARKTYFNPDAAKLIEDYYLMMGQGEGLIDESAFCRCKTWKAIKIVSITPEPAVEGESYMTVTFRDQAGPPKQVKFRTGRWINQVLLTDVQLANGQWMRASMIAAIREEKSHNPNAY